MQITVAFCCDAMKRMSSPLKWSAVTATTVPPPPLYRMESKVVELRPRIPIPSLTAAGSITLLSLLRLTCQPSSHPHVRSWLIPIMTTSLLYFSAHLGSPVRVPSASKARTRRRASARGLKGENGWKENDNAALPCALSALVSSKSTGQRPFIPCFYCLNCLLVCLYHCLCDMACQLNQALVSSPGDQQCMFAPEFT